MRVRRSPSTEVVSRLLGCCIFNCECVGDGGDGVDGVDSSDGGDSDSFETCRIVPSSCAAAGCWMMTTKVCGIAAETPWAALHAPGSRCSRCSRTAPGLSSPVNRVR